MPPDRFVLLHGFTQTHHHVHAFAHRLAERVGGDPTLVVVDLPGHGLSGDDAGGTIDAIGPRLVELAGRGTYVGYSMGGRTALVAAATRDPRVERLVLIGATPGIADPAERAERARLDDERAQRIEDIGVDAFLDEWLAGPLFAGLPADPLGLAHRRRNTAAGLAHSLRAHGTGMQTPLWSALGTIGIPVLALAGERDEKFTAIGRRMAELLPHGRFASIPDAGHAAHAERPAATADAIADWLAAT